MRRLAALIAAWGIGIAHASVFTVTSTADTSGSSCAANCTLRQAITAANALAGADEIRFNISSVASEIVIAPTTLLPLINDALFINGYSQPLSVENSSGRGSNAVIRIRLNDGASVTTGLRFCTSNVTVRGLSITGFTSGLTVGDPTHGISCDFSFSNVVVAGNFFGLTSDGTAAANSVGISLEGATATIGGDSLADRNLFGGNNIGIALIHADNSVVTNNVFGRNPAANAARANTIGLRIGTGTENVEVGRASAQNLFHSNGEGIVVSSDAGSGNSWPHNSFDAQTDLAIDLESAGDPPSGVTANDNGDADSGPNGLQNFPVLDYIVRTPEGIDAYGTFIHAVAGTYQLSIYSNTNCDASGHGEGRTLLGVIDHSFVGTGSSAFQIAVPLSSALASNLQLTMIATAPNGSSSEFSACSPSEPPPLVVNSTLDPGNGVCDAGECTLREAMQRAAGTAAVEVIQFDIPGSGERLITLASALPFVAKGLTIDGYSQPGSVVNTDAQISNAVPLVRVDGASTGANAIGFAIADNDVTIRGLSITSFGGAAIRIDRDNERLNNIVIAGNFIGWASNGATAARNTRAIDLSNADVRIGGSAPADRNVMIATTTILSLDGIGNDTQILGNMLGLARNGVQTQQASQAISLGLGAARWNIGSETAPNRISGQGLGIQATLSGDENVFYANHIGQSSALGIDLATLEDPAGVTENDADDADIGPNGLQNFPEILFARKSAAGLSVLARLDVPPSTQQQAYTIALYRSTNCDNSGFGEGEEFLGAQEVILSQGNHEQFEFELATNATLNAGQRITATATGPLGTSEFSACAALSDPLVVNSVNDIADGACDGAHCSLRDAIVAANASAANARVAITFAIPGEQAEPYGEFLIQLNSALPVLERSTVLDGYTQAGAAVNTDPLVSDAQIRIRVDGNSLPAGSSGLAICASNSIVRGLSMTRFSSAGILLGQLPGGGSCPSGRPDNVHVLGNFIGLTSDGQTAAVNGIGINAQAALGTIGGLAVADRNVIAAATHGVVMENQTSTGLIVHGNLIGTDRTGLLDRGGTTGIFSAHALNSVPTFVIGHTLAPNRIAFNGTGIRLESNALPRFEFFANDIFGNSGLGVDLVGASDPPNGVTPNDNNDADNGPNGLQNAPSISAAVWAPDHVTVDASLLTPVVVQQDFRFAFYESSSCDPSGFGEGEIFLGTRTENLSNNNHTLQFTLDPIAARRFLTMTVTTALGATSEFSNCMVVSDDLLVDGFE